MHSSCQPQNAHASPLRILPTDVALCKHNVLRGLAVVVGLLTIAASTGSWLLAHQTRHVQLVAQTVELQNKLHDAVAERKEMEKKLGAATAGDRKQVKHRETRCWFDELGNATDPAFPGKLWEPSWSQCSAATTNWGSDSNNAYRISQKIQHGDPLIVVAIGGSVTCGCRAIGNKRAAKAKRMTPTCGSDESKWTANKGPSCCNQNKSWTAYLEKVLQVQFGQYGSHVSVQAECQAAVGTAVFVDRILTEPSFRASLEAADIVLNELAVNDASSNVQDRISITEQLVNILQSLPNKPFLMWLTAAWVDKKTWSHMNLNGASTAEIEHLRVMRHYGIAHTSLLAMFRLSTRDIQSTVSTVSVHGKVLQRFLDECYYQDVVHPGDLGQRLIAAVVATRLIRQLKRPLSRNASGWFGQDNLPLHHPGFLNKQSQDMWKRYKSEADVTVDTFNLEGDCSAVTVLKGFALELEGSRKWGYIGHRVNDTFALCLPSNTFRVSIGALYSYEHNGVMRVRIIESTDSKCQVDCGASLVRQCKTCHTLADEFHETRWEAKASLRQNIEIVLSRPTHGQCQWLQVDVVHAPSRTEHKVKLLAISAFHKSNLGCKHIVAMHKTKPWLSQDKPNVYGCLDKDKRCTDQAVIKKHGIHCPTKKDGQFFYKSTIKKSLQKWWWIKCPNTCKVCCKHD